MHHRKWLMIAGLLVLALAVGWVAFKQQQGAKDDSTQTSTRELHPNGRSKSSFPALPSKSHGAANVQRETPPEKPVISDPHEAGKILEALHTAAVTYDAAQLPGIEPYLLHSNPDIRKAALDAMLILGDPAAGPLLRNAAARVSSPPEAVALLQAADYVELPSAKLKLTKKVKSTTPQVQTESRDPAATGPDSNQDN